MPLPTHIPHTPGTPAWHFATCDCVAEIEELYRLFTADVRAEIRSPLGNETLAVYRARLKVLRNGKV